MKISVITAVYNGEKYIEDCIKSILSQDHQDIDYVIVDGCSTDRTLEIVEKYRDPRFQVVSEKDKNLYDAMNKGLSRVKGDVVGILNADDFYTDPGVLSRVAETFEKNAEPIAIGDLEFVDPDNTDKVTRFVTPKGFTNSNFLKGECPPHPPFFVRRNLYEKYGHFNIQYPVTADYELMLRFMMVKGEKWVHIPKTLIRMRTGGVSNRGLMDKIKFNSQKIEICRSHGLDTHWFKMYSRYFGKAWKLVTKGRL